MKNTAGVVGKKLWLILLVFWAVGLSAQSVSGSATLDQANLNGPEAAWAQSASERFDNGRPLSPPLAVVPVNGGSSSISRNYVVGGESAPLNHIERARSMGWGALAGTAMGLTVGLPVAFVHIHVALILILAFAAVGAVIGWNFGKGWG